MRELITEMAGQAGIGADALLQWASRVMPDKGKVVTIAQDELIKKTDGPADARIRGQVHLSRNRRIARG